MFLHFDLNQVITVGWTIVMQSFKDIPFDMSMDNMNFSSYGE